MNYVIRESEVANPKIVDYRQGVGMFWSDELGIWVEKFEDATQFPTRYYARRVMMQNCDRPCQVYHVKVPAATRQRAYLEDYKSTQVARELVRKQNVERRKKLKPIRDFLELGRVAYRYVFLEGDEQPFLAGKPAHCVDKDGQEIPGKLRCTWNDAKKGIIWVHSTQRIEVGKLWVLKHCGIDIDGEED